MLLGSNACQRLKPVTIMSGTLLDGPFLHLMCNHISDLHGQLLALFYCLFQFAVYLLRQTVLHNRIVKYIAAKDFLYVDIISHFFLLFVPVYPVFLMRKDIFTSV